jgi:septal ring-binding cell division protein DamX
MLDIPSSDLATGLPTRLNTAKGKLEDKNKNNNKKEKTGKKEKKAGQRAEITQSLAALGADLARMELAVRHLGKRVGELQRAQLAPEDAVPGSTAQVAELAKRIEAISAATMAARGREDGMRSTIDQLKAAVDGLRAEAFVITDSLADIAAQPERDTALFVLEDRIEAAEEQIESELAAARQHGRAERESDRAWAEGRLRVLDRKLGTGLAALVLLGLALPAVSWWAAQRRATAGVPVAATAVSDQKAVLPVTAQRDALGPESAIGQLAATLRLAQAQNELLAQRLVERADEQRAAASERMRDRVLRIEQTQAELKRGQEESAQIAASLTKRLEAVVQSHRQGPPPSPDGRPAAGAPTENKATTVDAAAGDAADTGANEIVLSEPRYAIQLIAFRSEGSIAPFVRELGIVDRAHFMRSRNNEWYVVLFGNYSSLGEATAAAERLPDEMHALKPWVRPLPPGSRLYPIE